MSAESSSEVEVSQDATAALSEKAFSGFKWTYYASLKDGLHRSRAHKTLRETRWDSLLHYATKKRNGKECKLLPEIGLGYNHVVRVIEFSDGLRWVARLRMPTLEVEAHPAIENIMRSEYCAVSLAQRTPGIPVPRVHALETDSGGSVNAPFMLMDCLNGNVGMDLGLRVPEEHKKSFFPEMAKIQVAISTIQLPKIGTILSINDDGTCVQGPIPGIGGPFDTATAYFKAWATHAKFGNSQERLRAASGPYADEIVSAVASLPQSIHDLAEWLSVRDNGPFPLYHGDFGHNNIVVDDEYRVLGVIDWESAFAAPWELAGALPLTLSTTPPAMDAPFNYDASGNPKDPNVVKKLADQAEYIRAVEAEEKRLEIENGCTISTILRDLDRQSVIAAMRLYSEGTAGLYSRLLDQLSSRIGRGAR